jgi:hypothetical protein
VRYALPLIELSSISENLRIEKTKCKRGFNFYYTFKGEGRRLKRIVFVMVVMLLAVFSSGTIAKVNSATIASIVLLPPDTTTSPGSTFVLNLTINNVADMYAWSVTLVYQKIITLNSIDTINNTAFTDGSGLAIFKTEDYNSSYYRSYIARTLLDVTPGISRPGVTGSGLVAHLNFMAASTGTPAIYSSNSEIIDSKGNAITPITVTTPTITVAIVQPPPSPPPPSTVGGWSFSVAKASARDIDLVSIAAIAVFAIIAPAIYFKGLKRRKEKQ